MMVVGQEERRKVRSAREDRDGMVRDFKVRGARGETDGKVSNRRDEQVSGRRDGGRAVVDARKVGHGSRCYIDMRRET